MSTLENHFVNIEVKLQDIEEGLESALKLLDRWILKQQPEEQSQPQFDEYIEISSLDTEYELLEDMCLATLFRENEGDIDAFADRSLDALSAEDDSNIGEFGGLVFDLFSIENGNKVLTTSLNSEEVHSDEDKLVKTRNKKNIEVGTVKLLMHSQFSPSRFLEDHEVDFNLLVLDEYSKFGREIAAPYMFDQLPERNGMSRNNMNFDHVPLASWYPILAGYFDVNSCNDFMLEYEIMILDKYERIRFQGVKNTINSKICDVYSRLSWKEVLSWKVGPDTILSKITASYNLWLNLESDKKTGSCEEIRKSIFLTIEEIPKLIAELWIDGMGVPELNSILDDEHSFIVIKEKLEKLKLDECEAFEVKPLDGKIHIEMVVDESKEMEHDEQHVMEIKRPLVALSDELNSPATSEGKLSVVCIKICYIEGILITNHGFNSKFKLMEEKLEELELDECKAFEVETEKQNNINIGGLLIANHEFNIKSVKPMVNFDVTGNYDILGYRIDIAITSGSIYKIVAAVYEDKIDDITSENPSILALVKLWISQLMLLLVNTVQFCRPHFLVLIFEDKDLLRKGVLIHDIRSCRNSSEVYCPHQQLVSPLIS